MVPDETAMRLDLERYVPGLLTFLANKLSRGASVLYRKHFGVGIIEWRVMALLAIEPGITAARVCHVIGLDKAPASRALSGLRQRGLVVEERDTRDQRRRLARLTPAGVALHDRIIEVALERERLLLGCLEAAERDALIALLNRLHANLDAVKRADPKRRG
jgi:DNA-binding MarR family transcriptional regulator